MYLMQRSVILPLRFGILNQSRTPKLIQPSNTRTFIQRGNMSKMERVEQKSKLKDKMPSTATLIYNNPSAFLIASIFHFQNAIIIFGSVKLINFVREYLNGEVEFPLRFHDYVIAKSLKEFSFFTGITFFIFLLSSFICRFNTLRVYFDRAEKVNKAILVSYLPFKKRVIDIKPKTVTPVIRRFPVEDFKTFEFKVDGKRMFLFDSYFKRPEDFNRMLKYYY